MICEIEVGREVLESSSTAFQAVANLSQLPTLKPVNKKARCHRTPGFVNRAGKRQVSGAEFIELAKSAQFITGAIKLAALTHELGGISRHRRTQCERIETREALKIDPLCHDRTSQRSQSEGRSEN